MTRDPVCGMQIDEKKAEGKIRHEGEIYYFCSTGCREKFARDPKRFVPAPGQERSDRS